MYHFFKGMRCVAMNNWIGSLVGWSRTKCALSCQISRRSAVHRQRRRKANAWRIWWSRRTTWPRQCSTSSRWLFENFLLRFYLLNFNHFLNFDLFLIQNFWKMIFNSFLQSTNLGRLTTDPNAAANLLKLLPGIHQQVQGAQIGSEVLGSLTQSLPPEIRNMPGMRFIPAGLRPAHSPLTAGGGRGDLNTAIDQVKLISNRVRPWLHEDKNPHGSLNHLSQSAYCPRSLLLASDLFHFLN